MPEIIQGILKQTTGISWMDILDIIIVAYVVYKGIFLVRETRAEQLIKGILILVVALQVSGWLQMNAINYILRNTMQVGFLALIILFTPELRRALEHMGRSNISNFFKIEEDNVEERKKLAIQEICSAASSMAASKTGALIVIERKTKIGDLVRTGTVLNATTSASLIENLFFPNSPLHDGAVVIRDARIFAAGCYLPLTENGHLSKELGTRHRAGIGVSEVADCVVVIVSEETGTISLAIDGSLTRNMTIDTLKAVLIRLLVAEQTEDNKSKSLIKKVKKKWTKKS